MNMTEPINIKQAEDVTPECLKAAEEVFEGFFDYDGQSIEWDSFWDRLEKWGYCVSDLYCPAANKIQRHIRKHRSAE
jgi:hypothetical protein